MESACHDDDDDDDNDDDNNDNNNDYDEHNDVGFMLISKISVMQGAFSFGTEAVDRGFFLECSKDPHYLFQYLHHYSISE